MGLFNNKELLIMLSVFAILFLIIVILSIIDFFESRRERRMIEKTLSLDLDEVKKELTQEQVVEQQVTVIESTTIDEKKVFKEDNEEMFKTTDYLPIKKVKEEPTIVAEEEVVLKQEVVEPVVEKKEEVKETKVEKEVFISPLGISYETPNKGYQSIYENKVEEPVEDILFEEEEVIFKQPVVDKIVYEENVPNRDAAVEMLLNVEKTIAREEKFEDTITNFEMEQEKTAIISLDELSKISDNLYDVNEVNQYDDGDEPITIDEVIKKFNSSNISFENTATYTKFKKSTFDNELEEALREQE